MWGSAALKMPIHAHFFRRAILTRKVTLAACSHITSMRSRFVNRSVHANYKSLCAAVTTCFTLIVNIQTRMYTHRQQFDQFIWKISAGWCNKNFFIWHKIFDASKPIFREHLLWAECMPMPMRIGSDSSGLGAMRYISSIINWPFLTQQQQQQQE